MRNGLLLFLAALLIAPVANAQLPPKGYMGLYTDELHNGWCVNGTGFYPATMWVWCLPSEHGMVCAEFEINYPVNVIQSTTMFHPDLGIIIDPPEEGFSLCYQSCRWDWVWLFYQSLWVTDPTPTYIEIVKFPDPDITDIQFANCDPGYPVEPVTKHTNFYINYDPASSECSGTATESASWGAIKSLARR